MIIKLICLLLFGNKTSSSLQMIYLRIALIKACGQRLCTFIIRWLYFALAWGGKAGALFLLNVIDSSGAPVGCARTDAQTQASHWLELGGHSAVSPAPLSWYRVFCLPAVRRPPARRGQIHFFVLLITDKVSQKLCVYAEWPLFWRGKKSLDLDPYRTPGRAVFSMDLSAVEVPWELNYIWVLFTPQISF